MTTLNIYALKQMKQILTDLNGKRDSHTVHTRETAISFFPQCTNQSATEANHLHDSGVKGYNILSIHIYIQRTSYLMETE